jgi:hypothetical protein
MRRFSAVLLSLMLANVPAAASAGCDFSQWMSFKGTKLFRNADKTAYAYKTTHSRIDADGAPNAYHPGDVNKHCTHDPHLGLDCPANAGYPNTNWWTSVLVVDPQDSSKAYVQPAGAFKGFLVAKTWLAASPVIDNGLSAANYVDSTKVPYIVFPGSQFAGLAGTGNRGDVGIAWNLSNGKWTAFIVADKGGGDDAKLGEGSIALYEALGGHDINARNGAGVAPGEMLFVVFPRSAKTPRWPRTPSSIKEQADSLLASVGGKEKFKDCH